MVLASLSCRVVWCVDVVRRRFGGVIHFRCWNIVRTVRAVCLLVLFCIRWDTSFVIECPSGTMVATDTLSSNFIVFILAVSVG